MTQGWLRSSIVQSWWSQQKQLRAKHTKLYRKKWATSSNLWEKKQIRDTLEGRIECKTNALMKKWIQVLEGWQAHAMNEEWSLETCWQNFTWIIECEKEWRKWVFEDSWVDQEWKRRHFLREQELLESIAFGMLISLWTWKFRLTRFLQMCSLLLMDESSV